MTPVLLADVEQFLIPSEIIDATDQALRDAGRRGAEMFVLWTGHVREDVFTAATAYVPEQQAHQLSDGLCVTVPGPALHALNRWLYDRQQTLAVQVHTHPTDAYHSRTDDTYPIVTQRGGLSLVVPSFAVAGIRGPGTALYRLNGKGWQRLRRRPANKLLLLDSGHANEMSTN
jgi:hypothetical protein